MRSHNKRKVPVSPEGRHETASLFHVLYQAEQTSKPQAETTQRAFLSLM